MAAPKGNQFWKLRSSHGPKPVFEDPEQLWAACVEYFEWVEANPLYEDRLVSYQGDSKHEPVAKMRAMTVEGLCIFLDIHKSTWAGYRSRDGFEDVVARVDAVIRTQKFEGAAAELLNPNIIARDLGLADKSELAAKVEHGGTIEHKPLWEQVRAWGYMFNECVEKAVLADDEKARQTALAWLTYHIVPALKGETYHGSSLKDARVNRKEKTSDQTEEAQG
jgi:hypothetical protein